MITLECTNCGEIWQDDDEEAECPRCGSGHTRRQDPVDLSDIPMPEVTITPEQHDARTLMAFHRDNAHAAHTRNQKAGMPLE